MYFFKYPIPSLLFCKERRVLSDSYVITLSLSPSLSPPPDGKWRQKSQRRSTHDPVEVIGLYGSEKTTERDDGIRAPQTEDGGTVVRMEIGIAADGGARGLALVPLTGGAVAEIAHTEAVPGTADPVELTVDREILFWFFFLSYLMNTMARSISRISHSLFAISSDHWSGVQERIVRAWICGISPSIALLTSRWRFCGGGPVQQ